MRERPILFSDPAAARFEAHVFTEPNTGCWLWGGALNEKGYGRSGRGELAHKAAVCLDGREIADGMEVDHLCRARACVNPAHLEVVTHAENIRRKPAAPPTCPHGHAMTLVAGKRKCRACERLRKARAYRVRHPEPKRRGRPRLGTAEKQAIRALVADGLSHAEIAARVGVSVSTVSRVRNADA
jgi:predicted DNA-binding protein (UPF0251 family)